MFHMDLQFLYEKYIAVILSIFYVATITLLCVLSVAYNSFEFWQKNTTVIYINNSKNNSNNHFK